MVLIKERVNKLIDCIKELIYSQIYPIKEYKMLKAEEKIKDFYNLDTSSWAVMRSNDIWGGHQEVYYFQTEITILKECVGKKIVYELRTGKEGEWDALNPQFLAFVNGQIKQGLDVNHREILLTNSAEEGEKFCILLQAFTGDSNFFLHIDSEYKVLESEIEQYYYNLSVPYEIARLLEPDNMDYIHIIQSLNESLNLLDMREKYSKEFYESLEKAQAYLEKKFYDTYCGTSKQMVYCVGHTHIDIAWLWTLKTTADKAVRSFSTVLELMREYPEYKFMSSQPQLYQYVKQNAPEIYEEIRKRIAEGRWEAEGGMFVEADCNLASGESLVRQFTHGIRFFVKEFGKRNEILWLPDVFGYSAALPQIMKKCGISYFMTTKISWSEFNKMPYDTFLWEGIDGSEVLTHFIPTRDYGKGAKEGSAENEYFTTYNGMLKPIQIKGSWQRYSQKYLNQEVLMAYGYGDGGGGATKEMLENQRRLQKGIPGCPTTRQSTALEFFKQLEQNVTGKKYLPKWVGELYLEYHRGTYTSMARNKKYNRKAEFSLLNLECYAIMAQQLLGTQYPDEQISCAWETILKNQFHDILPGSSIKEVYEESQKEYETILSENEERTSEFLNQIVSHISGNKGDFIIFNPNSVSGKAVVSLNLEEKTNIALSDGIHSYPIQKTNSGMIAVVDKIPSKGYKRFFIVEHITQKNEWNISKTHIQTPFFNIILNEKGQFTSIYDKKAQREIVPKGSRANVIMSYEDKPHNFDAWDINHYYTENSWEIDDIVSISVIERGVVRACIKVEYIYLSSKIVQYLYFYKDLYQIDIQTEVDWKEKQILVRDYFPIDIHTNEATFEIQYGNVKRPTHQNTSWDFAKFEVCAHKWIDVSEYGYGVSILNDCKYGCNVKGNVIGLSLLKSAVYPNPEADKEHHSFIYSICPHEGSFQKGNTITKAYLLNNPYRAIQKENINGTLPEIYSLFQVDSNNVIIEVVKKEDLGESIIVRLYECYNCRTKVTLTSAILFSKVYECNLLEEEENELIVKNTKVSFEIKPFEIKTLKIFL